MLSGQEVDRFPDVRAPCLGSGEQREGLNEVEMRFINRVHVCKS